MKSPASVLVCLGVVLILLSAAKAIRLESEVKLVVASVKVSEKDTVRMSNLPIEEGTHLAESTEDSCWGITPCSVLRRKILAKVPAASTTADPSNISANKPPTASQKSSDLIDLVEMDYSPAKRKPPIHN